MDMKYKNVLNAHAYNRLTHSCPIPDFRLGIGESERLDSVPVLLFTDFSSPMQMPTFEKVSMQPIEKMSMTGDGKQITDEDFQNNAFFENIQLLNGGF